MANTQDTIIGRPLKSFDLSAFCSYNSFHPSEYLTDNNWDILCAFVQSGSTAKLDSLGIPYNRSQLRLLEVGDLLMCNNGHYTTKMHIFGKSETQQIRRQSKDFADSIFPTIESKIRRLVDAFEESGYSQQVYSLIFSYLLDNYIWGDEFLSSPRSCEDHGTWSGAYWAMFESRNHDKIGTNGYGPVKQNWTRRWGVVGLRFLDSQTVKTVNMASEGDDGSAPALTEAQKSGFPIRLASSLSPRSLAAST